MSIHHITIPFSLQIENKWMSGFDIFAKKLFGKRFMLN